jgi:putative transposase
MSKHRSLSLSDEQREHLDNLIRSGNAPARVQTRARILLHSDRSQGQARPDREVTQAVRVNPATVVRTRKAFLDEGMEAALYDKPRPGAAPKVTGDIEAKLITLVCSDAPAGRSRWTLRLLADKMVELNYIDSISNVTVYQRLKKTRLSPGK